MSDLDEQLKRVRLQKEQLELDRLLAKQQREKLILDLPTAAVKVLKVPLTAIASFATATRNLITANKKLLWGALLTGLFLCIGLVIYELDKSEKERQREQRYQAKLAEIIQEECGNHIKSSEICRKSMSSGKLNTIDVIACINTFNEEKYCVARARSTPIAVD
jgi:hypothetical protein